MKKKKSKSRFPIWSCPSRAETDVPAQPAKVSHAPNVWPAAYEHVMAIVRDQQRIIKKKTSFLYVKKMKINNGFR